MSMFGEPPVNQFGSAGVYYATTPLAAGFGAPPSKQVFLRDRRRRMNSIAMLVCVVVPWALFSAMYAVTSFELHYKDSEVCLLIVVLAFLAATSVAGYAVLSRMKWLSAGPEGAAREPTWLIFLAFTMLLAWVLGVSLVSTNYKSNMRPYYDMGSLNEYVNVSVTKMRGSQLMDAGTIDFEEGTRIDVSKSMGFKSDTVYCVAPITPGAAPLPTYDFWAVGTGCCSGTRPDFHCAGWNAARAHGALRVLADPSRAFYRLAVQQAEAAHKIKAVHPLFFTWVPDARSTVDSWHSRGVSNCVVLIVAYFILQSALVAAASLLFARLGQL